MGVCPCQAQNSQARDAANTGAEAGWKSGGNGRTKGLHRFDRANPVPRAKSLFKSNTCMRGISKTLKN
jgi:hypothetical protein